MSDGGLWAELEGVRRLVWGSEIQDDLFKRWSQGFVVSADEPTALVQLEGGPCAIIAPVQAFLLVHLLGDRTLMQGGLWRQLPRPTVDEILVKALTRILCQARAVRLQAPKSALPRTARGRSGAEEAEALPSTHDAFSLVVFEAPCAEDSLHRLRQEVDERNENPAPQSAEAVFHGHLRLLRLQSEEEVGRTLAAQLPTLKAHCGLLQFLYSLILTKGVEEVRSELSESSESLVDPLHGHGSQSLINLMLTGRAHNYVWDHEQDVGGLKLVGIVEPVEVGFLTLLERLRYCEVGSFFKNPKSPVWVLGSETHLTVLFSTNMELVCPETPAETARRIFHTFDPEGNNFISAVLLEDVLRALDLVSDADYVEVMKSRLDPEALGIVLLNDFLAEFFPRESPPRPDTFPVFHCNALRRASPSASASGKTGVVYEEGEAVLLETDLRAVPEDKILTCLQTKWPSIDVAWTSGTSPSIN